jgi:hypothetical protein
MNRLTLKKTTVQNLTLQHMGRIQGGGTLKLCTADTCNYSECGTGPATIGGPACCPDTNYSQCGTGPASIGGPTCC